MLYEMMKDKLKDLEQVMDNLPTKAIKTKDYMINMYKFPNNSKINIILRDCWLEVTKDKNGIIYTTTARFNEQNLNDVIKVLKRENLLSRETQKIEQLSIMDYIYGENHGCHG